VRSRRLRVHLWLHTVERCAVTSKMFGDGFSIGTGFYLVMEFVLQV